MPRLFNSASPRNRPPVPSPLSAVAQDQTITAAFDFEDDGDDHDGNKPATFVEKKQDEHVKQDQVDPEEDDDDNEDDVDNIVAPQVPSATPAKDTRSLFPLPSRLPLLPFQTPREPIKAGKKRGFDLISTPKPPMTTSSTTLLHQSVPSKSSAATPFLKGGEFAIKAAAAISIYEDKFKVKHSNGRGGDELERSRLGEIEAKLVKSSSANSSYTSSYANELLLAAKEQLATLKANFNLLTSVISASTTKSGPLPNRAKILSTSSTLVTPSSLPPFIEVTLFGRDRDDQGILRLGPLTAEGCLPFREAMRARVQLLKGPLLQIQRKLETSGVSGISGDEAGREYMRFLKLYKDARTQLERLDSTQ
jgi:hypothetical protein